MKKLGLDLLYADFKSTILNILKEIKKIVDKELRETRRMMVPHQRGNIKKETDIIKRKQIEIQS